MRIAIHTQYYPPEMGAPQARLSSLARWLAGRGHEVFILTAMPNYPEGKIHPGYGGLFLKEDKGGLTILRAGIFSCKSKNLLPRLLNYASFLFFSFVVGVAVLPRVDFLLTETPPPFLGLAGWALARLKGARWILNVSDLWVESMKDFGRLREQGLVHSLLRGMCRFLYRRACLVTGQSREILEEIRRQVPAACLHHLCNGADCRTFHPGKKTGDVRRRYLKDNEVGFVYAGLHGFFQGLDQILLAAERLKGEGVRFVFLGDGVEKGELVEMSRRMALENVDFYPPIPHQEVPSILASMDVAVMPLKRTIRGSVPSKIYEAMACGRPILLISKGEAGEILGRAGAGLAVDPGDLDALVKAIRKMAGCPEERENMGVRGRQAAERLYDRQNIASAFEEALLERIKPGDTNRWAGEVRPIQEKMTILRAEGEALWASRGYRLYRSVDGGESWLAEGETPVSFWRRTIERSPLLRRMSRGGISGIRPQEDGSRLCVAAGMIFRAEADSVEYRPVFRVPKGFRPLNLGQGPLGRIYWGEYFLNVRRKSPARIFGSKDGGKSWNLAYTFPAGSVCHIHRVIFDPYEEAYWVCTGDLGIEVGIWKTIDEFRQLTPILRGEQLFRTTSLLALPRCLLYGTDDPRGDNYILALDRRSGAVEKIQSVPGPILYGCRVGEGAVFATMVEKKAHEVTLWAGDENAFHMVGHLPTRKMNQLWRESVGYDTVILPEGHCLWPYLYCTPLGTAESSGKLLRVALGGKIDVAERPAAGPPEEKENPKRMERVYAGL